VMHNDRMSGGGSGSALPSHARPARSLPSVRDGRRVRLAATVLVIAALPFGTWMSAGTRLVIVAVFVANHLLASLAEWAASRDPRVPHQIISAVLGVLAIFVASLLNPRGEIVMLLAFLVLVAYFASSAGRAVASVASAAAIAVSLLVSVIHDNDPDHGPDIDVLTFVVFIFTMGVTSLLVDRLTGDRIRAARESERQQREFLAAVSHELRTPLTAIQGFVEAVLEDWGHLSDDDRRAMLRRAGANAAVLDDLIAQLLEYTRLETAGVELEPVPVELAASLGAAVDSLPEAVAPARVVNVVSPDIVVHVDPVALRHVIVNLVTNAAKFAPGSAVTIDAVSDGDEIVVSVADDGPGIADADRVRIFERFAQVCGGHGGRGVGLDLSIVAGYVARSGGRVWVESEPGRGATFLFTLPAAPVAPGHQLDRSV